MRIAHFKKIIWVERLTFLDVSFFIALSIFQESGIRYDEHQVTPLAKKLLKFLRILGLGRNFYEAHLSLDKKDNYGYGLIYQKENNLNTCLNEFIERYFSLEEESFKNMIKSYITVYPVFLDNRISFITMVEHDKYFNGPQGENIFYLSSSPFNIILSDFYRKKGYRIKESFWSPSILKFYFRPLYYLFLILIYRLSWRKPKYNLHAIKPSIWIEYYYYAQRVDLSFWHKEVDKSNIDIVFYLARDDDGPIERAAQKIEEKGFKWIDLHFHSLIKLANIKISEIRELISFVSFSNRRCPFFCSVFKFEQRMWFLLYRSVFKRYKVKVIIQREEVSWMQEPQARAIKSVGGIMIGFHWSSYTYWREAARILPHHIFFVWGKILFEWAQKRGNTCHYILPSGLWLPEVTIKQDEPAYFAQRPKFVIAIFDSSVDYNSQQGPKNLSAFYLRVLKLLNMNRHWGGIVKCKNWNLDELKFLPRGDEIVSLIEAMAAENRLIFLSRFVFPSTVALYADLSVCYGINSAGVISGIHGAHVIHWNSSGLLHHPFYKDTTQQFVFGNLNEFEQAIIKVSNGDKNIGDFSRWKQQFNYFDDFEAYKRVGKFIQSFMEKVEDSSCEDPLLIATQRYITENNVNDTFFSLEGRWDRT